MHRPLKLIAALGFAAGCAWISRTSVQTGSFKIATSSPTWHAQLPCSSLVTMPWSSPNITQNVGGGG